MNWLDWSKVGEQPEGFHAFVASVIEIRRKQQLLAQPRFLHGEETVDGRPDVRFRRTDGRGMGQGDWENPDTRALGVYFSDDQQQLAMLFNAHHEPLEFTLPAGDDWCIVLDTADHELATPGQRITDTITVSERSLILIERSHA